MKTPVFVLDLEVMAANAMLLASVKQRAECKVLMALKAFSVPACFPVFNKLLDGTCASSVHEARLGVECFGGESHAFAAAFTEDQMRALLRLGVGHFTLNSFAQLRQMRTILQEVEFSKCAPVIGLRVNPEHSEGHTAIYDPCAPGSRLGIRAATFEGEDLSGVSGLHFHTLCEQDSYCLERTLQAFEERFAAYLQQMKWFNFGGGHHITRADYDVDHLVGLIKGFKTRWPGTTVYLEPGEACVLNAGTLAATVLDVVENGGPIAVLDASCACHTPDVMEMPYRPRIFRQQDWNESAVPAATAERAGEPGEHRLTYRLTGPSCLAGDVFGDYSFDTPLMPGDKLYFEDMAHYTLVKTNTFNGINLPDICLRHADGRLEVIREFGYEDFLMRLQ